MNSPTERLAVKVVPGSSRDGIMGWLGEALKIKVAAPPEKGKANAAVCRVLAKALAIPEAKVRVVGGHTTPNKMIQVQGLSAAELRERLPVKREAGDGD